MSEPDWANLPSVVLFDLYHILPIHDRIEASSTCKRWREAFYFYPNWRKLHLNTAHCNQEKNNFFALKAKKWCRSLFITYVAEDYSEVIDILKDWSCNTRMTEFQLLGSGDPNETSFTSQFSTTLYPFIENCAHLTSLFLSHFSDFGRLSAVLAKHNSTLTNLGLGALYPVPEAEETLPSMISSGLSGLQELKVLQLDGMWVNEESLFWIGQNLPKLKIFIISLKEGNKIADIPQGTWEDFHRVLHRCEIHVNYHRMTITDSEKEYRGRPYIISKALNITHVRMIYCSREFQEECLNALMRERALLHTVTSIWSISDLSIRDVFFKHPFVVCSWRFKHLKEIVLSGSIFDDYDLVGMVRMRPSLWIHIAKEDIAVQDGACFRSISGNELNKTIELLQEMLKPNAKPWSPMDAKRFNDPALPPKDRESLVLREILSDDLKCRTTSGTSQKKE